MLTLTRSGYGEAVKAVLTYKQLLDQNLEGRLRKELATLVVQYIVFLRILRKYRGPAPTRRELTPIQTLEGTSLQGSQPLKNGTSRRLQSSSLIWKTIGFLTHPRHSDGKFYR